MVAGAGWVEPTPLAWGGRVGAGPVPQRAVGPHGDLEFTVSAAGARRMPYPEQEK